MSASHKESESGYLEKPPHAWKQLHGPDPMPSIPNYRGVDNEDRVLSPTVLHLRKDGKGTILINGLLDEILALPKLSSYLDLRNLAGKHPHR